MDFLECDKLRTRNLIENVEFFVSPSNPITYSQPLPNFSSAVPCAKRVAT